MASDLAEVQHYAGRARQDADGNFDLEGLEGSLWNRSFLWSGSFLWSDSLLWSDGLAETVSINAWVPQE